MGFTDGGFDDVVPVSGGVRADHVAICAYAVSLEILEWVFQTIAKGRGQK